MPWEPSRLSELQGTRTPTPCTLPLVAPVVTVGLASLGSGTVGFDYLNRWIAFVPKP